MITVRKLAERFGLSRTTLLYYDRIKLLRPTTRSKSGYRLYGDDRIAQLRLICTYKNAGLTLKEIRDLMAKPEEPDEDDVPDEEVEEDAEDEDEFDA